VGVYVSANKTKTPDRKYLKLGTVVVLNSLSKPVDFGFKGSKVRVTGSSFQTFGTPFISVEWMQLQSSNFVLKCTTSGYCLRIKNYAGMRRVSRSHLHNALSNVNVK